jgi:hypothetical protein
LIRFREIGRISSSFTFEFADSFDEVLEFACCVLIQTFVFPSPMPDKRAEYEPGDKKRYQGYEETESDPG